MCKQGDEIRIRVPISAECSHSGEFYWKDCPVDRCLVPLVQALNAAGMYTGGCCCGHGKEGRTAYIGLHDGTRLTVDHLVDTDAAVCGSSKEPEWVPGPA